MTNLIPLMLLCMVGYTISASKKNPYKYVNDTNIYNLTDENFDNVTKVGKDTKNWFIMFYAPWCPHCKKSFPLWISLARNFSGKLNVGMVDCEVSKTLKDRFLVSGYPSFIFLTKNGKMIEYKEGRSSDDMVKFVTHDYLRYPTEEIPMEYSFWRSLQKQFNIISIIIMFIVLIFLCFCCWCEFCAKDEDETNEEGEEGEEGEGEEEEGDGTENSEGKKTRTSARRTTAGDDDDEDDDDEVETKNKKEIDGSKNAKPEGDTKKKDDKKGGKQGKTEDKKEDAKKETSKKDENKKEEPKKGKGSESSGKDKSKGDKKGDNKKEKAGEKVKKD